MSFGCQVAAPIRLIVIQGIAGISITRRSECYLRWHCTFTLTATRSVYTPRYGWFFIVNLCLWKDVSHKYTVPCSVVSLLVWRISHKSNSRATLKLAFKFSIPIQRSLCFILCLPMSYTIDSLEIVLVRRFLCQTLCFFVRPRWLGWRRTTTNYQRTLMGETEPLWGGECFQSNVIYHANIITVYRNIWDFHDVFEGSSPLEKHPGRCGNHNRMEICFYGTAQVRNLPMKFFSFYHNTTRHSLVDHFVGGSPNISGLS